MCSARAAVPGAPHMCVRCSLGKGLLTTAPWCVLGVERLAHHADRSASSPRPASILCLNLPTELELPLVTDSKRARELAQVSGCLDSRCTFHNKSMSWHSDCIRHLPGLRESPEPVTGQVSEQQSKAPTLNGAKFSRETWPPCQALLRGQAVLPGYHRPLRWLPHLFTERWGAS